MTIILWILGILCLLYVIMWLVYLCVKFAEWRGWRL